MKLTPGPSGVGLQMDCVRQTAAWVALAVTMAAPATAGSAAAHGVSTPRGHALEDFVVESRATQARLNRHTKKVSAAESRAATVAGSPDEVGQWGPVVDWPVVAVFAALLPNGKVLAYDSVGDHATETYPDQTFSRATVWDPTTGSQTDVAVTTATTSSAVAGAPEMASVHCRRQQGPGAQRNRPDPLFDPAPTRGAWAPTWPRVAGIRR